MVRTRKDLYKLSGTWSDEILWYARGVSELKSRPTSDRTSWTYLAAMHGIDPNGWVTEGIIPSLTALPPVGEQDVLFNQCQHAGWFFLPWHRGYLAAFESILAAWIAAQPNGPADWALPYWNYLGSGAAARDIPAEFLDANLPDGSPNPLLAPRGGTPVLGPQPWLPRDITLDAQTTVMPYTAAPGTTGYGGAISGFANEGDLPGAVELNPHNIVHVMIGGLGMGAPVGWMSDPSYAALDPIFWLHHCNIDRFWAARLSNPGSDQEGSTAWRNGPFPRQFRMPDPQGGLFVFVPGETLPGGPLTPSYDDLSDGTGIPVVIAAGGQALPASLSTGPSGTSSLVGANDRSLIVSAAPARTSVRLEAGQAVPAALGAAPERYYLNLEGVRGAAVSGVLNVAIDAGQTDAASVSETVVLFGLARASATEGHQAGNGLSVAIDITDLVGQLAGPVLPENLRVQISQPEGVETPVTVDRVSVYKRPAD